MSPVVGRLAPTPSGHLHLGNVVAFGAAWLSAKSQGGRVLLRIEDIDTTRSRQEVISSQKRDLEWLGLTWDEETPQQSIRDYTAALNALSASLYHCQCTRAQRQRFNGVYPGTCRDLGHSEGALRLRLQDGVMQFHDRGIGSMTVLPESCGDPSLVRRDGIISYNLAVVTDDIADGVTEVVRGSDLLDHTAVQIQIWKRLGATPPTWLHSPLVLGDDGRKLSKSHGSAHIGLLRDCGWTPSDIWRQVLPWLQLDEFDNLWDASGVFSPSPRMSQIIRLHADASDHPPSPKEGFHWSPTGHPSSR